VKRATSVARQVRIRKRSRDAVTCKRKHAAQTLRAVRLRTFAISMLQWQSQSQTAFDSRSLHIYTLRDHLYQGDTGRHYIAIDYERLLSLSYALPAPRLTPQGACPVFTSLYILVRIRRASTSSHPHSVRIARCACSLSSVSQPTDAHSA
jgi:hypothetical protein